MTLTPYPISETARRIARTSGFDIDNPDQRYQVHNLVIKNVLAARRQQLDPRVRLLLKGRKALGRVLGREIP